jgi:ribosomal protein L11 methyltransferase
MHLQELKLIVSSEVVDELVDQLMDSGALSVAIEDAYADTEQEQKIFDDPMYQEEPELWRNSLVYALFNPDVVLKPLIQSLLKKLNITAEKIVISVLENKDWVQASQAQFETIYISDQLCIAPSWRKPEKEVTCAVKLDPGLAFGTGSHPTTFLCLSWLEKHVQKNQSVLDYGCGSGILAITAKKLGAGDTFGVDIDRQAILCSRENAKANEVAVDFYLPEDFVRTRPFDIVIANILANPLKMLAQLLSSYVSSGGYLVLSGLLCEQEQEIIPYYQDAFDLSLWSKLDGWICLVGRKF